MLLHYYINNTQICFKEIFYFLEENSEGNLILATTLKYCIYFKIDLEIVIKLYYSCLCYCSTTFLGTIKYSDDLYDNIFPFFEGKKTFPRRS